MIKPDTSKMLLGVIYCKWFTGLSRLPRLVEVSMVPLPALPTLA
jgi:hypothetical protein